MNRGEISYRKPANVSIISVIFILLLSTTNVTPSYPDETGGYTITVAFEENVVEPDNTTSLLIENIKTSMSIFSEKLWEASKHKFYIKSVDILVPSSWTSVNASNSINHNYDTATIRISTSARVHAENPFTCGKPGLFIGLPPSFFSVSNSGPYGPHWKALLNLWATYRWGVYEEHGYIGNPKYPYSHKNLLTDELDVTGCSDQPITGRYLNNESVPCSASDTLYESSTCRFIPDQSTNATTSLMHFHWIDSIVNFCDETSHNIFSRNRQNALCEYKSVWEVIRETKDFHIVTNPILSIPPVEFKLVQHSTQPSLYILLDRGRIQGSLGVAYEIPRAITNFLNTVRPDLIAAIGTYPSSKEDGDYINNEIDWSPVGNNLNRFVDEIGALHINGPLQRNFAGSIVAATQTIKARARPSGVAVVMLVVKYGGDLSSFGTYPPESEVIHALNEQGIILNAIELRIANHSGHAHLSQLAQKTGGIYTVISNQAEAQTSFANLFGFLNRTLNENYSELIRNYQTLVKSSVMPGSVLRFNVPNSSGNMKGLGKVEGYFSSNNGSLSANNLSFEGVYLNGSTTPITELAVRKRLDWLENGSKWTYSWELAHDKITAYSEIMVRACSACHGSMLIRTNLMDDATKNVTVSVFTNYENSTIDLSGNEPIIVFVKIFNSNVPVVGAQVLASITDASQQRPLSVYLTDNGEGSPDKDIYDGIYSGYITPSRDGDYKISILVQGSGSKYISQYATSNRSKFVSNIPYGYGRLLPIDQEMGCSGTTCDTATLTNGFMQSIDLPTNLKVMNAGNHIPDPTRISEFIISPDLTSEAFYTFIWIAPTVPGTLFSVSSYDIRLSSQKASLITDFDNQVRVPGAIKPGAPGAIETLQVAKPVSTTFYAIRSAYGGRQSKISNVEEIKIQTQITTTTNVPPTSTDMTPTSTDMPPTSTDMPPTSTDMPPTSTDMPPTSTDMPPTSTDMPPTSTDMPPTSTNMPPTSTNMPPTSTDMPSTTTTITSSTPPQSTSSSTIPSTTTDATETSSQSPPTTDSVMPTPSDDKKPWAKTGGGIAIITVIVVIVAAAIVFVIFYLWKMRGTSTVKINPPPQQPRASIPS